MCGIAAIYAYREETPPVSRSELLRMRDQMTSRGPDGRGLWIDENRRVGLAHRRLSIIDLTDSAAQPMHSEDGSQVISFNGEIYNYLELRNQLELKGHVFHTRSDTEVLLHLYAEYGNGMVRHLRGMFAFALWDAAGKKMLLARDPFGIKPLYYADDGRSIRLASQVKALCRSTIEVSIEAAGVVGFYLLGSVPEPWTIYREIKAIPAGSLVEVTGQGVSDPVCVLSVAALWADAEQEAVAESGSILPDVRHALLDTVRHHMVSDVPVGAFLSAGIDSSALVGIMVELQRDAGRNSRDIQTLTLAFSEFAGTHNDESVLAEQVAALYGTTHTTRIVGKEEFQKELPGILASMDQPTIDGINTWFVSKAAREQGIKVALSGLGGDELFGGYPSFQDIPRWVKWMHPLASVPFAGDLVQKLAGALSLIVPGIHPKMAGMVKFGGTFFGAWFLKRALFMPWELEEMLNPDMIQAGLERLDLPDSLGRELSPEPGSSFGRVATLETNLYMRNQLLRDTDWASMAHSLEVRVPLVDPVLLKTLGPYLLNNPTIGKKLLGQCPRPGLPREVLLRKKTGFSTPLSSWLGSMENDTLGFGEAGQHNEPWGRTWARVVGGKCL